MSEKECTCGQTREAGEIPTGGDFKSKYKLCEVHGIPRWMGAEHSPKKITFAEFEDLLLKQIGEAFDMSREALFAAVDPLKPKLRPYQQKAIDDLMESFKQPKLIQGYTAENWQEIIDGGYLCEFSLVSFESNGHVRLGNLLDFSTGTGFKQKGRSLNWSHCRPAQIKGVMRPIFVEPLDEDVYCHFFSGSGSLLFSGKWAEIGTTDEVRKQVKLLNGATKYIEL